MNETKRSVRKRLPERKTRRSGRVKSRNVVTEKMIKTKSMVQKQLLEDEGKSKARSKPEKLMDLPHDMLLELMVDEENTKTPVAFSDDPTLKITITEEKCQLELVKNTTNSKLNVLNPSFSQLKGYLRKLNRLEFEIGVNPPSYLKFGTKEYEDLQTFIGTQCLVKKVTIWNSPIEYVTGNIMDLFPERTLFSLCIYTEKLVAESPKLFDKDIECIDIKGITSKKVAEDLMHRKFIPFLHLRCSEPVCLRTAVQQWTKNEREIQFWEIKCPSPVSHVSSYSSFKRIGRGDKVLKITISEKADNGYYTFQLFEE